MNSSLILAIAVMSLIILALVVDQIRAARLRWTAIPRAVRQIVALFHEKMPDRRLVEHVDSPHSGSIELPGHWFVKLENKPKGLYARALRPGLPGADDPPFHLRSRFDYDLLLHALTRYTSGMLTVYDLRPGAVYEVLNDFTDHNNSLFTAGTRMTFVNRRFLPYEGGHTLIFDECRVYIQDETELYASFHKYFALAGTQTMDGVWPPAPSTMSPLSGGEGEGERSTAG